ncbi:Peroxiredoxin [Chthonomonas calidirosea]|nr:Peroxiredoxin [Chthonomonas calidirosea]CEK19115.1 Peroxiredoxin [Chthonomonas calidirosea]CEK20101.1 Peroxiredoxin [Chthonomonas calidirosea]
MEKEIWQAFKKRGVQVLGIAVPEGANPTQEQLLSFKKRHGLTYPLLADDDGKVATRFGVQGIPDIRILDRDHRYVGQAQDVSQAVQMVQRLLNLKTSADKPQKPRSSP